MAIEEYLAGRAHNGAIRAYFRIDTAANPAQLIGVRLVVPAGYVISGTLGDTSWTFDAATVAALPDGIYPLEAPIDGVWHEDPDDAERSGWQWPPLGFGVKYIG